VNPWDVLTWLSSAALAVSGVLIFGIFLRDARAILTKDLHHPDDETPESDDCRGD
jgi:hypothetical protein